MEREIKYLLEELDGDGIHLEDAQDAVDGYSDRLSDYQGESILSTFDDLDNLLLELDGSGIVYNDVRRVKAYAEEYFSFPMTVTLNESAALW